MTATTELAIHAGTKLFRAADEQYLFVYDPDCIDEYGEPCYREDAATREAGALVWIVEPGDVHIVFLTEHEIDLAREGGSYGPVEMTEFLRHLVGEGA